MKTPYELVYGQTSRSLIVRDITIKGIVDENEDYQDEEEERSKGKHKVGSISENCQDSGQEGDDDQEKDIAHVSVDDKEDSCFTGGDSGKKNRRQ